MEKIINAFMDEFQKNIPPALFELKEVIAAHVRSTAETVIHKMDLVTREEFDTQLLVLRRSREKLEAIEKKVIQLTEAATQKKTTPGQRTRKKSTINEASQSAKQVPQDDQLSDQKVIKSESKRKETGIKSKTVKSDAKKKMAGSNVKTGKSVPKKKE